MSELSANDLVWMYDKMFRLLVERKKLSSSDALEVLAEVKKELTDAKEASE